MRVLVIAHGFPPLAQGGSEIYAYDHARALRERCGDEVFVLTRDHDPSRADYELRVEERDGLRVAWVNNTFRATTSFEDSYRNPTIARIAERLVDEWTPEVAHAHHLTCLSTEIVGVLTSRGIPIVYTLHDYWLLCHRGQRLDTSYKVCDGPGPTGCAACVHPGADAPLPAGVVPALRAVEARLPKAVGAAGRRLVTAITPEAPPAHSASAVRTRHMRDVLQHIDHFLAPSHAMRDWFIGQGVPAERIGFSPYGLDHAPLRAATREPAAQVRIGYIGTLMVSKGPDVLLEAFARLPPGRATVELFGAPADYHGETSYRARLEPLLSLPGVRVSGPRPHAQIPDALASMDVMVAPSIWPENSPFVIQEALLSGIPVIASRTGGIPELVAHGRNGLLFEPGDVEGLHQALARLLDEPGLRDTLTAGARATSFRTLDDDVRAAQALYERLANERTVASERSGRPSGLPQRRIAAVVVNYHTPADTQLAVKSLLASRLPLQQVIVVDNDATDELRAVASAWGPAVTYLHTGANLGFAGGVNAGVRAALASGADAVLLVNSDVVLAPSCLTYLDRALAAHPDAAIAAPLLLARTDPATVASAGIDYDRRTGRMRERHAGRPRHAVDLSAGRRVAASGCVLLVTRAAWERAGLLDERYFFGFEDIDFCLRAAAVGLGTCFDARAVAYHEGGGSLGPASPRRFYFAVRNHLLLAADHHAGGPLARLSRPLAVLALNVAHALTSPGGSRAVKLGATLRGALDYARGRFGPARGTPEGSPHDL
jgi:GT2 family glycosyltransferase/glycosyltransferase involved in cell wall biosynthesis